MLSGLLPCRFSRLGSARIGCATFTRSHELRERITKESEHYVIKNYFTGSKKINGFIERIAPLIEGMEVSMCTLCRNNFGNNGMQKELRLMLE